MSLMQLPAPNTPANFIVGIRYALLPFELCMHACSRVVCCSFTVRRAFQSRKCLPKTLKHALPVNVSNLGIGIAGFCGTFSF